MVIPFHFISYSKTLFLNLSGIIHSMDLIILRGFSSIIILDDLP